MKVAIYARVSTESQEKQETIDSQLEVLRNYARSNNHIVCAEYIDEGYSGELLDRPDLDRLRDDAKKKIFDVVLVHSPDRLSRKYIYLGLVQEELKKYGINIVFLNRPDSKDTPEDNLLTGVQGLIAEYEKAKILERTRRGRLYKARERQLIVSSIGPYGYRYVPKDRSREGYYELIPEEASVVKMIFDLFVNKQMSIRAIARALTQRGIKPRKGRLWRTSTLNKILRNETYAGLAHYNKHISIEPVKPKKDNSYRRRKNATLQLRPKEQWIPIQLPEHLRIIEGTLFERAQRQLKKNSQFSPRNVKYQYLLRGLIECGNCGSPYLGTPCHNRLFYRCGNRHRTFPYPRECHAPMRSAPMLEDLVWSTFCTAIENPRLIIEQIEKLRLSRAKYGKGAESELEKVEAALGNLQNEEDRLLDAYRSGIISMEQLKAQMSKIQEKKNILSQESLRLAKMAAQVISVGILKKSIRDYCQIVKTRLKNLTFEKKQQVLRLLIHKIILEREKVRIKAKIPVSQPDRHIAFTASLQCVHNTPEGIEFELVANLY